MQRTSTYVDPVTDHDTRRYQTTFQHHKFTAFVSFRTFSENADRKPFVSKRVVETKSEQLTYDCQTGTVAVIKPLPKPVTIRPTMNWAKPNEVVWRIVPMTMTVAPAKITFRRPNLSPTYKQISAPTIHPRHGDSSSQMIDKWLRKIYSHGGAKLHLPIS